MHTPKWKWIVLLPLLASCNSLTVVPLQPGKATVHLVLPEGIVSQQQPVAGVPGEYLVTFRRSSDLTRLPAAQVLSSNPDRAEVLMRAGSIRELQQLPGVLRVQPNYRYQLQAEPNDPYLQQSLDPGNPETRQWYLEQIGAPGAWNDTGTSTRIKVAVLDDGYTHHADLPLSNLDLQPMGCDTQTGEGCLNAADKNDDPYNTDFSFTSHGMDILGLLAAGTNNGQGIASLSWNGLGGSPLQVIPINIFGRAGATSEVLARAIRTAIARGAKVINLSLCLVQGPECADIVADPVIDAALQQARAAGVVVVASAGNYGKGFVAYPANHPAVVAVASSTIRKTRSDFSQYGGHLRMVAPGETLVLLQGISSPERTEGHTYHLNSGTSFSAPLVAGAAGLLFSKRPDASWEQVVGALMHSGEALNDPTLSGVPFLRIDRALQAIAGNPAPPPALKGSYQAVVKLDGQDLPGPLAFGFNSHTLQVLGQQELSAGTHTIEARILDRYQPDQVAFTCSGTVEVPSGDLVNQDIVCQ